MKIGRKTVTSLVVFATIIIIVVIVARVNTYLLKKNHSLVQGRVYNCRSGGRGNESYIFAEYTFNVNNREYTNSMQYLASSISYNDCDRYLINRTFPIIYQEGRPKNSTILITPLDFKYWGYQFPDSLRWVVRLLKDGDREKG
jgi:hypothetical protein